MLPATETTGENRSARAPTLELHEIQATVLRPRPAPYFGTHVLLRIEDAQAGRAFLLEAKPYRLELCLRLFESPLCGQHVGKPPADLRIAARKR